MASSQKHNCIEVGESADVGTYQCASCGHVLEHTGGGELPTCPDDDGLHAIHAWRPIDSTDECDPALPNSPNKPR